MTKAFWILKQSNTCTRGPLSGVNSKSTYMAFVMQGLDLFLSVTHGLNEDLGRLRGREGEVECIISEAECESVVHVLWKCPAYTHVRSSCREGFRVKLKELIGDSFEQLSDIDKTLYR